jgi:hypothetical protein
VHRFETAHSAATHAFLMDAESRRVPELLAVDGVAGLWTFSSICTTLDPSWQPVAGSATFDLSGTDAGLFRAELIFIDGMPEQTWHGIGGVSTGPDDAGHEIFRSLLLPITAWEWDWFDGERIRRRSDAEAGRTVHHPADVRGGGHRRLE